MRVVTVGENPCDYPRPHRSFVEAPRSSTIADGADDRLIVENAGNSFNSAVKFNDAFSSLPILRPIDTDLPKWNHLKLPNIDQLTDEVDAEPARPSNRPTRMIKAGEHGSGPRQDPKVGKDSKPDIQATPIRKDFARPKENYLDTDFPGLIKELMEVMSHPVVQRPFDYKLPDWQNSPLSNSVFFASSQDKIGPEYPTRYFLLPLWRSERKEGFTILHYPSRKYKDVVYEVKTRSEIRVGPTNRGTIGEVESFEYKLRAGTVCPVNRSEMNVLTWKRWFKTPNEGQPTWEQLIGNIESILGGIKDRLDRKAAAAKKPSHWTKIKHLVRGGVLGGLRSAANGGSRS